MSYDRTTHRRSTMSGTPEMFQKFVEARDRLLAALGMSAPPPPKFAPKGVRVVYRVGNTESRRLAAGTCRPDDVSVISAHGNRNGFDGGLIGAMAAAVGFWSAN